MGQVQAGRGHAPRAATGPGPGISAAARAGDRPVRRPRPKTCPGADRETPSRPVVDAGVVFEDDFGRGPAGARRSRHRWRARRRGRAGPAGPRRSAGRFDGGRVTAKGGDGWSGARSLPRRTSHQAGERAEGARQATPEGLQVLRGVPARPVTPAGQNSPPTTPNAMRTPSGRESARAGRSAVRAVPVSSGCRCRLAGAPAAYRRGLRHRRPVHISPLLRPPPEVPDALRGSVPREHQGPPTHRGPW